MRNITFLQPRMLTFGRDWLAHGIGYLAPHGMHELPSQALRSFEDCLPTAG